MKRDRSITVLLVSFGVTALALAQPPSPPVDASIARKKQVLDAFKATGGASAAAQARANVDNASPRKPELQVGDQLREVSYWLANEHYARAIEAALLAVEEGEKAAKGKITAAEEADLNADNGRIIEAIVGDSAKAKQYYQDALRLNPKHVEAANGLARIVNLERRAAEKAQENEAMRLLKQNPPRR